MVFTPTRAAGLEQLAAFVPHAGRHYADGRNTDLGPGARSHVSLLSPYVRHRLLTEEEIVRAVLAVHAPPACEKFVQEVAWRTYWKGWLELRPAVWARFVADRDALSPTGELSPTGGLAKAIAAAEAGTTGIDGFDDWARDLVEHGYLHNHARMWFASIWIFTLGLPWVAGADFFLRHLVDADPASNTLSWRWVAGLQTAGKTYLATADNIARHTGGRFAPKGLAARATALTEAPLPAARPLAPLPAPSATTPSATTPALLLLTGEDLHGENLFADHPAGRAILAVHAVAAVPGWPWGDAAAAFVAGASADAATRAAAQFGCASSHAALLDPATLIAAARDAGAQQIVTAYAPVGPVATALAAIAPALAAAGLPLVSVRRDWDELLWPFATKGFFPFKERLPAALASLGMRY